MLYEIMCNKRVYGFRINQDTCISRKQLKYTFHDSLGSIGILLGDCINSAMNPRPLIVANWLGYSWCLKKWTILTHMSSFSALETNVSCPSALTKVVLTTPTACSRRCPRLKFCPPLVLNLSKVTSARCLHHSSLISLVANSLHHFTLTLNNVSYLNHIHKVFQSQN